MSRKKGVRLEDLKQKVPLPPRGGKFKGGGSIYGDPPPEARHDILRLMAASAARDETQAWMLLQRNPGKTVEELIASHRRERVAQKPWLRRFLERLRRAW